MKQLSIAFFAFFLFGVVVTQNSYAKEKVSYNLCKADSVADSIATRKTLIAIINKVIDASGSFEISAVAGLYTPNAMVADEEPPFSWNGPTAGAQWINTLEKTCKDFKIKKLKGKVGRINVYLQTSESVYLVVPVTYSGDVKGDSFEAEGAFTFVFRLEGGKWLIKSQVWVSRKGL